MDPFSDAKVIDSWSKNVSQWTSAVQLGQIETRQCVTNQAIVDAVLQQSPESVIDIGCGEGWLVRALSPHAVQLLGVDAVPSLVEQARALGGGEFRVASYEAIAQGVIDRRFDVAVCNFSLIGKESVEQLIAATPMFLKPDGVLIVQTLHPLMAGGDLPYCDGWRAGSWAGFDASFIDPAPWYFRTLKNWFALLSVNGLRVIDISEPLDPKTQQPASIIFSAVLAAGSEDAPS